jgi:hypothetical protein
VVRGRRQSGRRAHTAAGGSTRRNAFPIALSTAAVIVLMAAVLLARGGPSGSGGDVGVHLGRHPGFPHEIAKRVRGLTNVTGET